MLDTLPERLTLARQQKLPHQDLLLQILSDEVARRDSLAVTLRVQKARLDPTMRLEAWDNTAKVTFDRALLNELATLRFLDAHAHVTMVGPVGVGKTFLAHAPIANRRLIEQHELRIEAPELALDDLLEHVGRLAGVLHLRAIDRFLFLDRFGRHVFASHPLRIGRRDMHRDFLHQVAEVLGTRHEV